MSNHDIELEDISLDSKQQIVVENKIDSKVNADFFSLGAYNTKESE